MGRRTAALGVLAGARCVRIETGHGFAMDLAAHPVAARRGAVDRHPGRALQADLLQHFVDLCFGGFRLGRR